VDRRGTILGFDERIESLTGWSAVEVVGHDKDMARGLAPDERGGGSVTALSIYDGEPPWAPEGRSFNLTMSCRDGRRLHVEALSRVLPGPGERLLVTILRVLARSADTVDAAGGIDRLTGLRDRAAFRTQLAEDARASAATAQPMALVLLDIDHLREINDRLGREAGDEVLQHLAGILRVSVDDEQRIYRIGDDDFAILLPNAGRGDARQIAASLRSTVERYRLFPKVEGKVGAGVTLSLGAASSPTDAETDLDLLERAGDALNEAREMGRNRVWCYLRRPRVPLEVPVYLDSADSPLVGYSRDLSPSGIFVQTSVPLDLGMRCAFTFPLPGSEGKVHVIGRIVRTVPPETSFDTQELRIPGMGVEFERFGGNSDRHAIDAFLHDREATSLRPENGILSLG
jgi:diguanylate cyclase (GGDEF)-like protein